MRDQRDRGPDDQTARAERDPQPPRPAPGPSVAIEAGGIVTRFGVDGFQVDGFQIGKVVVAGHCQQRTPPPGAM